MLIGFIAGLISGVISTLLGYIILSLSKPKIKISEKIAKLSINGVNEYRFKVVNLSPHYAKNIKILFDMMTIENGNDGNILSTKPIPIVRKDIAFIEPYNKNDKDAQYAVRFKINGDLEEIWKDDGYSFLRLKVYCENEFNNSGKLFIKDYKKRRIAITQGDFNFGKSLEIQ